MRAAALILVALAGTACRRGALQDDAGAGTGTIGLDGAIAGDGPANSSDGVSATFDGPGARDVRFPTADDNCGMTGIGAVRRSAEILVVLDRAIAIQTDRWNTLLSAVAAMITRNGADVDWGLYAFPTAGGACGTATVGTTIDVMPAPDDATHVIAHLVAPGTVTGGTPTAAAIDVAAAYMSSHASMNPKFLMLVTDGAPTCAGETGQTGSPSADPVQAESDAVAAIAGALAAGLPTFVVAPSTTTGTDVDALNALALAGGYDQPGAVKFATEATLASWFPQTDNGNNCVVPLSTPPPVPDVVTVTLDGATVPRDTSHANGWDYTDQVTPHRTMQLYGAWCERVHTSRSFQIEVYFGCPNPG
jgi:hypothetical protein